MARAHVLLVSGPDSGAVHKTPPNPPQNTPFPGLNLKVGKMNYRLGNLDPNWAKCLKSGEKILEVGMAAAAN